MRLFILWVFVVLLIVSVLCKLAWWLIDPSNNDD